MDLSVGFSCAAAGVTLRVVWFSLDWILTGLRRPPVQQRWAS